MTSRIVIHVGMHKTATTHIQDIFYHNRKLLKRHGVVVPWIGKCRGQHGLASAWINLPPPYAIRAPRRAWQRLARAHARGSNAVFVSSEELSRLFPARVDMADLRELVSDFDRVELICGMRSQAGFLQSVYQQISAERHPGPLRMFLSSALQRGVVDGLALDYAALYRHFRTGFAASEIKLISYEDAVRQASGIVGAFLNILGVPFGPDELEPFIQGHSNPSPMPLASLLANRVSAPERARPDLVALVQSHLREGLPPQRRTTLFTRPELRQITHQFAASNAQLATMVQPVQPGFSIVPLPSADLVFRGQVPPEVWPAIASHLLRDTAEGAHRWHG
ncbi:MAG: hypothetical protein ABNH26_02985 [Celeribacter sp.]|jgi:hypothetical protein